MGSRCKMEYELVLLPEVSAFLAGLQRREFLRVAGHMDRLQQLGVLAGEPLTRQLDGKLRELRFRLRDRAVGITYFVASGRRIVLLTVFYKSRDHERRQVSRARIAMQRFMMEDEGPED
jgi:hypothetical protein